MNSLYLAACPPFSDPTLVWGSHIEMAPLEQFLQAQQAPASVLLSTAHVLLASTAKAMHRHPRFNCRVVGRRVYPLEGIHLLMPMLRSRGGEVDVAYLRHVETMSLTEIAANVWQSLETARRERAILQDSGSEGIRARRNDRRRRAWLHRLFAFGLTLSNNFRLPVFRFGQRLQEASALVNYLAYSDSPPLSYFKPSSLPTNAMATYVALGPTAPLVVADSGSPVVKRMALLIVRADHRIVDTPQIASFVTTLRDLLQNPESI